MATFRKLPSGRWLAEVCIKGVRKSKSWDTKARAKSWAVETEHQLGQQAEGSSQTHTLGDVFRLYGERVSVKKKGERWELVRLRSFEAYPLANIRLADLKREHIEDWMESRLTGPGAVKPSTINRDLNLISHCLTQARRWRLMTTNPMTDLKRPKDPPHRDRRISQAEIEALLITLNYDEKCEVAEQQQRTAVAFLLALETAMRQGELCSILPQHIDFERRTVHLPETKNGRPRDVPLSREAIRLLRRVEPYEEGRPVFRLTAATMSTLFRRAVARAGIEDLVFHDSRHEAITRLAGKLDVLDLARMVGHRDIKQLMTYFNKTAHELAGQLD